MWSYWNQTGKQIFCLGTWQDVYLGPVPWDLCALQLLLLEVMQYWLALHLVFCFQWHGTWQPGCLRAWGFATISPLSFFLILPQIPRWTSEKLTFCWRIQKAKGGWLWWWVGGKGEDSLDQMLSLGSLPLPFSSVYTSLHFEMKCFQAFGWCQNEKF